LFFIYFLYPLCLFRAYFVVWMRYFSPQPRPSFIHTLSCKLKFQHSVEKQPIIIKLSGRLLKTGT
jgi:hypothetical protein